ncbi:MAG: hypothetical protein E7Y34_02455, partial [Mycoplasma sp.]|nr:hypothetical protein [Mycoplasma sp.]
MLQQTNKVYEYFLEIQASLPNLDEKILDKFNQLKQLNEQFELILYKENNQYMLTFILNYEEKIISLIYIFKSVFILKSHLEKIIPLKLSELNNEYKQLIEIGINNSLTSITHIYRKFNKKINFLITEAKSNYISLSFDDLKQIIKQIYIDINDFKKMLYLKKNALSLSIKISNDIKNYFVDTIVPTTNEINKNYNLLIELAFINIDLKKIIDQLNRVYSKITFDFISILETQSIFELTNLELINDLKHKLMNLDIYTELMNKA